MATSGQQKDVVGAGAGLASAVAAETHGELGELTEIKARGYWEQVWLRFKRDKVAIASFFFIILLVLASFPGAWLAQKLLGHGPNDIFLSGERPGVDESLVPVGPMTRVSDPDGGTTLFVLGGDSTLGRDLFLRLLYGGRVSLQVAVLSTFGAMFVGTLLGAIAGYYRGWVDTVISRTIEVTMAFPALLFIIALSSTVGTRLDKITFGIFAEGVLTLVMVFTVFGWFYPARVIRSQVLSIREKEFIEAARMVGASDWRIVRSHVLPHLVAPVIVFSTLIVASYILAEAGLSFLGLGIKLPTASWGNLLSQAPDFYTQQPWLMIFPGLAVLLTTLAFNLLGDGMRDAFDPRGSR